MTICKIYTYSHLEMITSHNIWIHIRSYLFLGDINLYKVSEVCKRDMAEQERYLKQIDNPPVG